MGERELGTWLLSVAGILKGFLFNILVALKKKKAPPTKKKPKPKNLPTSQNKRDSSRCFCHAPGLRVVWEHLVSLKQSSGAAIFIKIPVFAWQNSGLEKQ